MLLYLIRHGQTEANRNRTFQGTTDFPLNETGNQQAIRIGEFLKTEPIHTIYTSSMKRAQQTAAPLAETRGIKPRPMDTFREVDCGRWEGVAFEHVLAEEPELLGKWLTDPETAIEIMTGSALPPGADTIVPVERYAREDGAIELEDGYVPIAHARTAAALTEEQRLLYVAVTRAMQRLPLVRAAYDEALEALAARDADLERLLELHYFGGYTVQEIAEAMDVSESTAKRQLRFARAWVRRSLER